MFTYKNYVNNALQDLKFEKLTEIQELVIPEALNQIDIIGQSQTGSGKTHAFLIPVFERLDESLKDVQAVISAPTRELATQIYDMAVHIASFSEEFIDIRLYVGGSDREKEINRLKVSKPQIVIGTPGKIKDLAIKENVLSVFKTKTFIIDEADMSLDSGFLEDIDQIAGLMNEDLHMMVFSATIPTSLKPFLNKYMNKPIHIHIKPKDISSLNIEHYFIKTKFKDKNELLIKLLKSLNPFLALVFCNTKEKTEEVSNYLRSNGLKVGLIHGGITPRQRKQIVKRIRNLDYQYVVASDIASRGIDIEGVSHVVNYELPKDIEFYIHRTGRTGRINHDGIAVTLYDLSDDVYLDKLENMGIKTNYKELKDNVLVDAKVRYQREKREKKLNENDIEARRMVKKNNKKVKPGYKKKYHGEVQKAKRQIRRKKGR